MCEIEGEKFVCLCKRKRKKEKETEREKWRNALVLEATTQVIRNDLEKEKEKEG